HLFTIDSPGGISPAGPLANALQIYETRTEAILPLLVHSGPETPGPPCVLRGNNVKGAPAMRPPRNWAFESPRHHKRSADWRGHGRVDAADGLPDDLVEEQIIGTVLDFQVEPPGELGHGGTHRVLGVDVHAGRAVDVGQGVGLGRE